jgi:hypothetical protein
MRSAGDVNDVFFMNCQLVYVRKSIFMFPGSDKFTICTMYPDCPFAITTERVEKVLIFSDAVNVQFIEMIERCEFE